MKPILHSVMRKGVLEAMRGSFPTLEKVGGAFSSAFSAAFDLNIARYEFSSAFSSDFAVFPQNKKSFSSAFSKAFACIP